MTAPDRPIVLVTHSYFEEDPRLRRQAGALLAAGWQVDVVALRRPGDAEAGWVEGAHVRRVDVQRHQGASPLTYLREYLSFFVRAGVRLVVDDRQRRYALVQVATLPDWLIFAALPLRLARVPIVIDLHEAMPEFFASRFPGLSRRPFRWLLVAAERASIRVANHAFTANEALRDRLVRAGVDSARVTVVPNLPATSRFEASAQGRRSFGADGVVRLVYTGAITPTYDLALVLEAMAAIRRYRPDVAIRFDVYGRGDTVGSLCDRATELGIRELVAFHGRIPVEDVPAVLADADIGLAPVAASAFTQLSFSTKLLEYGAMGLPVVAARLPLAERLLGRDAVELYDAGSPSALAHAILVLVDDPVARARHVATMSARVAVMRWEDASRGYLTKIEELARRDDPP